MKIAIAAASMLSLASAENARDSDEHRALQKDTARRGRRFTAPHEVHQYEQVKFFDEPMWDCTFENIGSRGAVGCLRCWNPGHIGDEALIVEVKAQYKRTDWNVRDETLDPPRKHCIWPGRGDFWTCFNSNLVIEPDTDWLGDFKDKPIYDENGDEGGSQCLPGSIVAGLPDNGAIQPRSI